MKDKYDSQDEEYFFDYLPDEVFHTLSEDERRHYREYRRYHHLLFKSNQKIDKYKKEIVQLKTLIKEERKKQMGGVRIEKGEEVESDGWSYKLKFHYDHVSHLDKLLRMKVTVEVRNRSSKSYKIKTGQIGRDRLERVGVTYKGVPLKKNIYLYGKVDSSSGQYRLLFYFGPEQTVREKLIPIYGYEIIEENINGLRWKLGQLMSQFTRYNVFFQGWESLLDESLNLDYVLDWVSQVKKDGLDIKKWG